MYLNRIMRHCFTSILNWQISRFLHHDLHVKDDAGGSQFKICKVKKNISRKYPSNFIIILVCIHYCRSHMDILKLKINSLSISLWFCELMSTVANFSWLSVMFINLVFPLSQDLFPSELIQFLIGVQENLCVIIYMLVFTCFQNKLTASTRIWFAPFSSWSFWLSWSFLLMYSSVKLETTYHDEYSCSSPFWTKKRTKWSVHLLRNDITEVPNLLKNKI
jgi:hypothetical protein